MNALKEGVNVSILGKEYTIACAPAEREALLAAAKHLDAKMREIQDTGRVIGAERCAVMAALNMAHEVLESRKGNGGNAPDVDRRLKFLHSKIDSALQHEQAAEL